MEREQKRKDNGFLVQGMILAVAGIITRLIGIAYRIPVTNIIGTEGQGFYSCAFSIYNIALLLTSYSLPLAVSKLVSARTSKGEYKNAMRIFKGALMFAFVAGGIVALVVFICGDFIAKNFMSLELSAYALKVLAPGLLIVAVMGVIRGYFQGLGSMVPTAFSQIIEQIINAIVSIIGASYLFEMGKKAAEAKNNELLPYAYGAAGGTLGTVSGALFGLIFLLVLLKAYSPIIKRKMQRESRHAVESYSEIYHTLFLTIAPVLLSTAIYNINDTIDIGLFSNIMAVQGHTEQDISDLLGRLSGHYNVLIHIPLAVANALGASLIPSLTAAVATGDKEKIHGKIQMVIRFSMLIAIPSFVGFMVLGKPILSLLFSDNVDVSARMLLVGAITVVFYCLSTITNSILQGLNKMTTPVKHGAMSLGIHLIAVFVFLVFFKLGIYALILGNIVFSLSMCILNTKALKKYADYYQEIEKTFVVPLCAAVIMGVISGVFYLLVNLILPGKLTTILALLIAMVTYGIALLKFGLMTPEEIIALPKGATLLSILQK